MNRQQLTRLTTFCIILIGVAVIMYTPKEAKSEHSFLQPTVFVHGYKGTYNSFGHMLERFEKDYRWGNKALVYHVSSDGKIRVKDLNKGKDVPVFIQVIFESNRASFADSSGYLSAAIHHMKENYQIDSINLVGHSMGGLVSLKFIEEYLNGNGQYPKINKFIAIGSPFDGIYSEEYFEVHRDAGAIDLKPNSQALQSLHINKTAFPKDIKVLSIASTGDVIAVPESVAALQTIIPGEQLQAILIDNKNLGHSALHENEEVDQLVHSFLYME